MIWSVQQQLIHHKTLLQGADRQCDVGCDEFHPLLLVVGGCDVFPMLDLLLVLPGLV